MVRTTLFSKIETRNNYILNKDVDISFQFETETKFGHPETKNNNRAYHRFPQGKNGFNCETILFLLNRLADSITLERIQNSIFVFKRRK